MLRLSGGSRRRGALAATTLVVLGRLPACRSRLELEMPMPTDGPPPCPPKLGRWTATDLPWIARYIVSMLDARYGGAKAVWGKSSTEVYALSDYDLVFRSRDHGASWNSQYGYGVWGPDYRAPVSVSAIWGWSDGVLLVRGTDLLYSRAGSINDLGSIADWTVRKIPDAGSPANSIGSIWGTGPDNIFLGVNRSVRRSSDGGITWTLQYQSDELACVCELWGPDATTLYMVDNTQYPRSENRYRRSVDQGRTWTRIYPRGPDGPIVPGSFTGYGDNLFSIDRKRIFHSRDGENWDVLYELAPGTDWASERFNRVYATRSGEIFAVGTVIVHRGPNDGDFHREANLGEVAELTDVWSDDCGEAFASAVGARIYHRE